MDELEQRTLLAGFSQLIDPNPNPGNQFGHSVVALSTGNIVVTSPWDDAGGTDAGAVYLFNGSTGALISTLRGSKAGDLIGSGGVTALSNGNFVISSPAWDNGSFFNAGAVTWGSGATGVSGVVSPVNSLVGSNTNDSVGNFGVTALTSGNYVVSSSYWDNGTILDAGAVTWGNGTTGITGILTSTNSLVGPSAGDQIGSNGITVLSNGNFVVCSSRWDNGTIYNAGAVTWGNGATGISGAVSPINSLVGSKYNDEVGNIRVTALTNGHFVVTSPFWDNGTIVNAGAVTWGNGATGIAGQVTPANSLVGSSSGDMVGYRGVTALTNGNFVVNSSEWNNGSNIKLGAVTWGNGTTGITGVVSAANSLVGSKSNDFVGSDGVTALSNGNFVVSSSNWDNGTFEDAGAVTWGNGTTGIAGVVSPSNSLVGTAKNHAVGFDGVTALTNGNYVVSSPYWDNGSTLNVGSVTWGNGTTGITGVVSPANSLVGSTYLDQVGLGGITALSNGNFVVRSPGWSNGTNGGVGAVTWCDGTTGTTGVVSTANSLVGSSAGDNVGSGGVTALTNGNYVVSSYFWKNGTIANAGAVTWGNGTTGTTGVVSTANSLVGKTFSDFVGLGGVTALSNGHFVVRSTEWINGTLDNAGAVTWGNGTTGVTGEISSANSVFGLSANTNLYPVVTDDVNGTFFARFLAEGSGVIRVGSQSTGFYSIQVASGSGQSAVVNTAFAQPLTVRALDAGGNPVAGVTVTFAAPATGATGSFAGGVVTAVTDASGYATSPLFTAGSVWGSYQITASAGAAAPVSFVMTNTPNASTVVVNSTSDTAQPGYTNLRQAVALATSRPGNDTVVFDPTVFATNQTIVLGSVITIKDTTGRTTIQGPSNSTLRISGNGTTGHFLNKSLTTMSNLTLTDGRGAGTLGFAPSGGAILNIANLTLNNIAIYDCSVTNGYGGAIASSWAGFDYPNDVTPNVSLHATNLVIARASAVGSIGHAGAIYSGAYNTGTSTSLTLIDSSISETYAKTTAGAISSQTGFFGGTANLTISNVTFTNTSTDPNPSTSSAGGVIFIGGYAASTTSIDRVTATGISSYFGGFLRTTVSSTAGNVVNVTVSNSTISNASATFGGAFDLSGPGTVTIRDSSFSNTRSTDNGGLIRVDSGSTSVRTVLNVNNVGIQNSRSDKNGGVIFAANATVSIDGANVKNATAVTNGGVVNQGSGTLSVANSTFEGCSATWGGGIYATNIATNVSNLTAIENTTSAGGFGSAIVALGGTLSIDRSAFLRNSSDRGGTVYANAATVSIDRSTFDENVVRVASALDGSALVVVRGNTTVERSSFARNVSKNSAAVLNFTGNLTVRSSTFDANLGNAGGAVYNYSQPVGTGAGLASLYVSDSTFKGNRATAGGAIFSAGYLEIDRSVFSGNSATNWAGALALQSWKFGSFNIPGSEIAIVRNTLFHNNSLTGQTAPTSGDEGGGAISVYAMEPTFVNSTIVGNDAGIYDGGGINQEARNQYPSKITLINTIVAGNRSATTVKDIDSPVEPGSTNNLIGDGTGVSGITNGVSGNIVGTAAAPIDPLLAPLGNYGGPTLSMPPLPGSPAIGAGKSGAGIPATDQRGKPRGGSIDIGSVQTQGFSFTEIGGSGQSTPVDTQFSAPLSVRVVPQDTNDPVAGGVVRFAVPASGASAAFAGGVNTAVIGANGTAISAVLKANTVAGQYQATASAVGVSGVASFTLINRAGPVANLSIVGGNPQTAVMTAAFDAPLVVKLTDAFGNLVENATVNFTVPGSGASATFAGGANTAVSNGSGIATSAVLTANGIVGSYVVSASAGSATPVSFSLTNRAPVLDQFVVQKGSTGRSFVRYVDMVFDTTANLGAIASSVGTANPRIRMTYKGMDGTQNVPYGLSNRIAAVDAVLALDFGTQGIGGNRNTIDGDGIYVVELDLDNNGSFETSRQFFRLLGDVNGDRVVDDKDTQFVAKNISPGIVNSAADANGDGAVNQIDQLIVVRQRRRRILV